MSNVQSWGEIIKTSFQNIGVGFINFIPNFLAAVVLFLVGWFIAVILGRLVAQVVNTIKLDGALRSAGFDKVVEKGGYSLNSGAFLGALVKWFFIVVTLTASLSILGLTDVTKYLSEQVLPYLPKVIIASIILLVSIVIAQVIQRLVVSSAKAANISHASVLGQIAKWAIWFLAISTVLQQLIPNFDSNVIFSLVMTLFTGLVAALALALGLAFGLGGRDAAARYIEKVRENSSK